MSYSLHRSLRRRERSYLRLDDLSVVRDMFCLQFAIRDPGDGLSLEFSSDGSGVGVGWRDIEPGEVRHGQTGAGGGLTRDVGDTVLNVLVRSHVQESRRDGGELRRGGGVGVALGHVAALTAAGLRGPDHGGGEGLPGVPDPDQGRGGEGEVGGLEGRRLRVGWRGRVVLVEPDQAVLSVAGGMVERTGRLEQVRDRKCHQVIICFLSLPSHSPPPPRVGAPGSPGQGPVHTLGHQAAVEVVQELGPGGGVGAPGVVVAVRRGVHDVRVDDHRDQHGGGLGREVRRGGWSHALPPPGRQVERNIRLACPPPP